LVVRYHLTAEDVQRLWDALGYAEDPLLEAVRTHPRRAAEVLDAYQHAWRTGQGATVHRLEPAVPAANHARPLTKFLTVFSSRPADVVDMSCHWQDSGDAWGAAHLLAGVAPWIEAETVLEWRWWYHAARVQSTLGYLEEAAGLLQAAQRHPPTTWHRMRAAMEDTRIRNHQDPQDATIPERVRALLAWRDPEHGPDPVAQAAGWDLFARWHAHHGDARRAEVALKAVAAVRRHRPTTPLDRAHYLTTAAWVAATRDADPAAYRAVRIALDHLDWTQVPVQELLALERDAMHLALRFGDPAAPALWNAHLHVCFGVRAYGWLRRLIAEAATLGLDDAPWRWMHAVLNTASPLGRPFAG
jgi:hypothetical protein